MSNLKQDLQNNLLQDLHPIVQQSDSLQLQNNQYQNSMSELENSFIQGKNSFQTLHQNFIFSDHTHLQKDNHFNFHQSQTQTGKNGHFNQTYQITESSLPQKIDTQQYNNTQKLNDDQNENKQYYHEEYNLSLTQELSESFNESNIGSVSRRGYRKKILPQDLNLNHKDYMLLGGKVISGLQKNIVSLPFRQPVDVQRFNIPDYHQVVKQPMDLRTIKRKIFNEEYETVQQIYTDIELIISNSMRYNELNPDFVRLTKNFEKSYYKIRRDCERNMKKFKIEQEKKNQTIPFLERNTRKIAKPIENNFPSNDVQIMSSFQFKQLTKLAKKIKKLQAQEQIQLFKKIGIVNTMVIDIKALNTKQVRSLIRQVEKFEKAKQQFIRNQQKKENSHLTNCDNEYRYVA